MVLYLNFATFYYIGHYITLFFFQIIFLSRTFDPVEKLFHLSSPNHSENPPFPDLLEILRIRIIKKFETDEALSETLLKMAREVKCESNFCDKGFSCNNLTVENIDSPGPITNS